MVVTPSRKKTWVHAYFNGARIVPVTDLTVTRSSKFAISAGFYSVATSMTWSMQDDDELPLR